MDCFMGMKFDDSQIVKVMDTYEDLVAEFGGDDGLALSVACKEVEYKNDMNKLNLCDNDSCLAMEIKYFDTATLKKVYKGKMVVRPWWSREYITEKQKDIEQIGGWAYSRME